MKHEVSLDEAVRHAEDAQRAGNSWHFHMLSPTCLFNSMKTKHVLLVENCTTGVEYAAESDERPAEIGKKLVALLHGNAILSGQGEAHSGTNPNTRKILSRARELNEQGVAWHHHMLFPDCSLNQNRGKWTLTFEDPITGEILTAAYPVEPKADLKEVEALFYAQPK